LTSVLGYPLDRAIEVLQSEGFCVKTEEARSKKGVLDGKEQRVIRQSEPIEKNVTLSTPCLKRNRTKRTIK
jgi:hypothetical protein